MNSTEKVKTQSLEHELCPQTWPLPTRRRVFGPSPPKTYPKPVDRLGERPQLSACCTVRAGCCCSARVMWVRSLSQTRKTWPYKQHKVGQAERLTQPLFWDGRSPLWVAPLTVYLLNKIGLVCIEGRRAVEQHLNKPHRNWFKTQPSFLAKRLKSDFREEVLPEYKCIYSVVNNDI